MQLRLIKPAELDQAALLADSVFREPGATSMKELFPLIFRPGLSHSYAAIADDGTVAAFMGLVPSTIKTGDAAFMNVFSIGAVCTDPAFRGQGLAGQLLQLCQTHAAEAEASLIFVSGDRSLYTRAGCVPFGGTQFAELNASSAQALAAAAGEEWTLRPMQPGDFFAVYRLLNEREAGHVYSPGELALLLGTEAYAGVMGLAQRTLVAVRDGSIEGFAAVAVPAAADVPAPNAATAVEWAGQPSAVAALLAKAALCGGVGTLQVPVPWQERGLLALLRDAGASLSGGANSGTVCIADREALLRQTEGCRKGLDLSSVQDDKELISLLFDPASSEDSDAIHLPYMSGLRFI
ncbi:GNAT family N-acetyltransferase [Paenibacillus sp. FSL P4-0184]|uniref:GNAT family N-acetyltransferase n=1 Tax=Paenibacillus sp. FSL P4-0184 TaxID=2921632 RepID=UPI0030F70CE8